MKELNGFMAVFTSPRGNIVSVVNFEQDADVCEKIMHQMCNSGGCKVKITPVTAPVEEVCQN